MQEMGVLSLRDVISFRVFHNALGLDLFSVISLEQQTTNEYNLVLGSVL